MDRDYNLSLAEIRLDRAKELLKDAKRTLQKCRKFKSYSEITRKQYCKLTGGYINGE